MLLFNIILLSVPTVLGQRAKILVVFPVPAYSHYSLGLRIAKELAERGHQVTAVNPFPEETPTKNYREVSVAGNVGCLEEARKLLLGWNPSDPLKNVASLWELGNSITDMTFKNENVQKLLSSGETYDVMILEHFLNDALIGIGQHFHVPVVLLAPLVPSLFNNHVFANPAPSSYIPHLLAPFTKKMSFWERLKNFYYNVLTDVVREFVFTSRQREIFKKYVKTDLELEDVVHNVSLMLINSHPSVTDPVPLQPNMIEIGGFHVKPLKRLPANLEKYLNESNEGVVLFSLGSNLRSKDLKPEVRGALLKAFSKIKQNVLWKFEEDLPDAPKNVRVIEWLPQQDVLAHPNVKLLISHGGLLSITEAIYYGVPILGIPFFGDQHKNMGTAVLNGYAVSVSLEDLREETFSSALGEILNNPKYKQQATWRSKIMHDRPLTPIDSAIYWIEFVIRNRGAPHLRSAGVDLQWYQREMLDIIIALTVFAIVTSDILFIIMKTFLGLSRTRKRHVTVFKKSE